MYTCTFFGHRDCPDSVYPLLKATVAELLAEKKIARFLIGNNGRFDSLAYRAVKELAAEYPHVFYFVVLSRLPKKGEPPSFASEELLLPDNFERFPPRFAVDRRNQYLLKNADIVVGYITHPFGGAAKFIHAAAQKGKIVINLAPGMLSE